MNTTDLRRVWKAGDSLAVTIPFRVGRELNLKPGDVVHARFRAVDIAEAPPPEVIERRQKLLAEVLPALQWLANLD